VTLSERLIPCLHGDAAETELEKATLFYNDFHFLAHQCWLLTHWVRRTLIGDDVSLFTLIDFVPSLRKKGDEMLSKWIHRESSKVTCCVRELFNLEGLKKSTGIEEVTYDHPAFRSRFSAEFEQLSKSLSYICRTMHVRFFYLFSIRSCHNMDIDQIKCCRQPSLIVGFAISSFRYSMLLCVLS